MISYYHIFFTYLTLSVVLKPGKTITAWYQPCTGKKKKNQTSLYNFIFSVQRYSINKTILFTVRVTFCVLLVISTPF